jgi:hypothetical protein
MRSEGHGSALHKTLDRHLRVSSRIDHAAFTACDLTGCLVPPFKLIVSCSTVHDSHLLVSPTTSAFKEKSMNNRMISRAAAVVVMGGLMAGAAIAQDAKAPATAAAPAGAPAAAPASALKPDAWVGLGVTSSDGAVLGKVTSLKASGDGKATLLYVTSPTDGKIFAIPSEIATVSGAGLLVKATAAELGKMVK